MEPWSGFRKPSMHSTVDVFPEPFGPIIANISPCSTENETWFTARTFLYDTVKSSTKTISVAIVISSSTTGLFISYRIVYALTTGVVAEVCCAVQQVDSYV